MEKDKPKNTYRKSQEVKYSPCKYLEKQHNQTSPRKIQTKRSETSPRKHQTKLQNETKHTRKNQNKQFSNSSLHKNEEFGESSSPRKLQDERHSEPPTTITESIKPPKMSIQNYDDPYNVEFERTLGLIKPNAMTKAKSIESMVKKRGLLLLKRRRIYLKPEQARDFYLQSLEEENNKYYRIYQELIASEGSSAVPDLRLDGTEKTVENSNMEEYVDFMTSGPVELLIIAGRGAVSKWLELIGPEDPKTARATNPESIRARFGGESILRNGVYGSENAEQAENEIKYFFPEVKAETDARIGASGEYLSKTVNPILLKGLIQLCRQKPDNPLVWLADWLLANNPNAKP